MSQMEVMDLEEDCEVQVVNLKLVEEVEELVQEGDHVDEAPTPGIRGPDRYGPNQAPRWPGPWSRVMF